jgi:NAD(P)H-dependent FMN reductase
MPDPSKAPGWMRETDATIQAAAGFIVLSAEYNCNIPPALANMMAHFSPTSYRHRPCGLLSYSMGNNNQIEF